MENSWFTGGTDKYNPRCAVWISPDRRLYRATSRASRLLINSSTTLAKQDDFPFLFFRVHCISSQLDSLIRDFE